MNEQFGVRQLCYRFSHQRARLYIRRSAIMCASARRMRALFCVNGTIQNVAHFLDKRARRKRFL